jgi:transcriptional regulator of heat shock response
LFAFSSLFGLLDQSQKTRSACVSALSRYTIEQVLCTAKVRAAAKLRNAQLILLEAKKAMLIRKLMTRSNSVRSLHCNEPTFSAQKNNKQNSLSQAERWLQQLHAQQQELQAMACALEEEKTELCRQEEEMQQVKELYAVLKLDDTADRTFSFTQKLHQNSSAALQFSDECKIC